MAATLVCISGCEEQEAKSPSDIQNEKSQPAITQTQPAPLSQDQQPLQQTQQPKPKTKSKLDIVAGVERLRAMQKKAAEQMKARAAKKTADPNSTEK